LFADWQTRLNEGRYLKVATVFGNTANEGDLFGARLRLLQLNPPLNLTYRQYSDLATDGVFRCPTASAAATRIRNSNTFPWIWRYNYTGVFDDINNKNPLLRAYHASEVPMAFQTYNFSTFPYSPTHNEVELARYMQRAWVAFARSPYNGLDDLAIWRRYYPWNASFPTINTLGTPANATGVVYQGSEYIDAVCNEYDADARKDLVRQAITDFGGLL